MIVASNTKTITDSAKKPRVAIVGGGPGGLFSAWHLRAKLGDLCDIDLFEADDRLGGKIVTKDLPGIGVYEAGVAEIYDYSKLGPDPLRDLIVDELKLEVRLIEGGPCFLSDTLVLGDEDLLRHFGAEVHQEVMDFRARCAQLLSPQDYYLSPPDVDNAHPWLKIDGLDLLQEIKNETARRYIRIMAHSDVAAAPYQTNGLTFLKNAVMDLGGYMRIGSVIGGNETLVERLVENLDAAIRIGASVRAVTPIEGGAGYRLDVLIQGVLEIHEADYVILATPLSALPLIHWRCEALQNAIDKHIHYFDRPAHYLRVVIVFERPFWRDLVSTHWWMLDQFDGCCVYDESARNNTRGYGVLSFLIAGNAALNLANLSDDRIERLCLEALPSAFSNGRSLVVESRVHRWMASVNATPGGALARPRLKNHVPEPDRAPGVFIVGDYLFDSTLNGVMDSADVTSDLILTKILEKRHAAKAHQSDKAPSVKAAVENAIAIWPARTLIEMFAAAWGAAPGAKILHFGCGSGLLVAAFRALGYEAVGVECCQKNYHAQDMARDCALLPLDAPLPFPDAGFDIVIETSLYRLNEEDQEKTIKELRRIAKKGLFLGSPVIDAPLDLLEQYSILDGAKTLRSRWDWAEMLHPAGFRHSLMGASRLDAVWSHALAAGAGPGHWCEDINDVLYSFYEVGLDNYPL